MASATHFYVLSLVRPFFSHSFTIEISRFPHRPERSNVSGAQRRTVDFALNEKNDEQMKTALVCFAFGKRQTQSQMPNHRIVEDNLFSMQVCVGIAFDPQ